MNFLNNLNKIFMQNNNNQGPQTPPPVPHTPVSVATKPTKVFRENQFRNPVANGANAPAPVPAHNAAQPAQHNNNQGHTQ